VARAVIAAPNRAEARLALAQVHFQSGDPASAVTELRRAIGLAPSLAEAHEMLGRISLEAGRVDAAMRSLQAALTLNPQLTGTRVELARAHALLGSWAEVWRLLDGALTREAASVVGTTYMRMSIWSDDEARLALWERSRAEAPSSTKLQGDLVAMYRRERRAEVLTPLDRLMAEKKIERRFRTFLLQVKAELLGSSPQTTAPALEALSQAVDDGLLDLAWLDRCPLLVPLRSEPTFAGLRARVVERVAPILAALDA
jgi:serine/threonine-protein kinase